jgi:hypothetical protein
MKIWRKTLVRLGVSGVIGKNSKKKYVGRGNNLDHEFEGEQS